MSVAPYPHVEIGVRDESIYTPIETENLPLNKPLYMMKCQKGPVGVPVWCSSYTLACRVFGEDTFNKRSIYFSEQAYFLLQTFPSNGAFIMRVADKEAKTAVISIELGVQKTNGGTVQKVDVPQWLRDSNGRFQLEIDGSKIPVKADGTRCEELTEGARIYSRALESNAIAEHMPYYTRKGNYDYAEVVPETRVKANTDYFKGEGVPTFVAAGDSFDSTAWYFELTSTSEVVDEVTVTTYKATSVLSLTAEQFDATKASKQYLVFAGYKGGYRQAVGREIPEIPAGSYLGDRFLRIDLSAIEVAPTADGYEAVPDASVELGGKQKYETWVFTRALSASNPYTYTEIDLPAGMPLANGVYYYDSGEFEPGQLEPQASIKGLKLAWRAHVRSDYVNNPVGTVEPTDTDNFTWYPMIDVAATNPGVWGNRFGLRLFFDSNNNTVSGTLANSAVTYSLAPMQLIGEDTTPTEIVDAYGLSITTGVMRKGAVDPVTDVDLCMEKRLGRAYSGNYALPITVTYIFENWDKVGRMVMDAEIAADTRSAMAAVNPTRFSDVQNLIMDAEGNLVAATFVDNLFEKVATPDDTAADDAGYMANVLSCIDGDKVPYYASCVIDATDELCTTDSTINADLGSIVVPSAQTTIYLGSGDDGQLGDFYIESYIRAMITATVGQVQEYLIDYARCPFNAIYDTGVSLTTKKAYCDLLSVRDSLVVNLATQQTWVDKNGANYAVAGYYPNARMDDESIGSTLRAYAWLMREDIANGTECCRCKIFLHAGYRDDHDGPIASTLWIALKNAQYLNRRYIYKEAKELPNSDVGCWTKISWVASSEDTRSRCWNAGLNYVQYYDMTHYHYASVRSVYRYETSILVDAGVVDALTFMKDEVRRSWATWAGSTRPAGELNKLITDDLNARFAYLLNGKYNFNVSVYQTDEDMKLGYVRHVDIQLIAPGTNRVWLATIICRRENFTPEA